MIQAVKTVSWFEVFEVLVDMSQKVSLIQLIFLVSGAPPLSPSQIKVNKTLFDPKMNWFMPKIDTTRTFFCERMT